MGSVKVRPLAKERRWRGISSPDARARALIFTRPDPHLGPATGCPGIERVVVSVPVIEIGHRVRQRPHPLSFFEHSLGGSGAVRAQRARGDTLSRASSSAWKCSGPARLEVGLPVTLVTLDDPRWPAGRGALRSASRHRQGAAGGGELFGRSPCPARRTRSRSQTIVLGPGAEEDQAAGRCPRSARRLLGED